VKAKSDVMQARSHRTTIRKSERTTNEGQSYVPTIQYDDAETRPHNIGESTVCIGVHAQISQKSQEDDATSDLYESLDHIHVRGVLPQQPVVYDELADVSDNQTSSNFCGF